MTNHFVAYMMKLIAYNSSSVVECVLIIIALLLQLSLLIYKHLKEKVPKLN